MAGTYVVDIQRNLASTMQACIDDAVRRYTAKGDDIDRHPIVTDVRVWLQKWDESTCGFMDDPLAIEGIFLAPTVVVKMHKKLRYVYHNGRFAYAITSFVSLHYYDAMAGRKLPGALDKSGIGMLNYT